MINFQLQIYFYSNPNPKVSVFMHAQVDELTD